MNIVFYDGECGLCNGVVQFVLKYDRFEQYSFCQLQSQLADKLLSSAGISVNMDTMHIQTDLEVLEKSDAVLYLGESLFSWSRVVLQMIRLLPKSCRDWSYDLIAKNRYRLNISNTCAMPRSGWKDRFLE